MLGSDDDRWQVVVNALKYFAKKLESLKEDQDIKNVNGILVNDIQESISHVSELAKRFDRENLNRNRMIEANQMVCGILLTYAEDLEKSKESLHSKIPHVKMETKSINFEILVSKELHEIFCKQ